MFDTSYEYIDPLSLPRYEAATRLNGHVPLGVWVELPETEKRLTRYAPEFIDDPDQTGMFKGLGDAPYLFPPNFIATAPNATLVGYRMVLSGEHFFTDQSFGGNTEQFIKKIGQEDLFPNEDTRLRRIDQTGSFRLDKAYRNIRQIKGNVVALTSTEPSNYGSFLFRVLPKIAALKTNQLLDLPMIVYANHASYTDLLVLAGVKAENIIRHDTNVITNVERLIIPSLRNPDAYLDATSVHFFQGLIDKIGGHTISGRRIYISRLDHAKRGGSTRVLLNEEQLIQRLTDIGIEIFEPEKHSSLEQIQVFSSAEMIIGPSGAGMFNTVFCRPGTKIIDIESEPHWIYAHTGLFASKGLRYGIFVGKSMAEDTRPVHRSWTVNIDALVDRIESFIN